MRPRGGPSVASTLVVVAHGKWVGVVTERDIRLVEALPGVDVSTAFTGDVMTPFVLASPRDPVRAVVARMAERKLGAAIVTENDEVVGVFTAIGALDVLARELSHAR